MADRLVEEHWATRRPRVMDARLDALRKRADYLAQKLDRWPKDVRIFERQEYAALMWAIAELTGIGDEVRRERLEVEQVKASKYRAAVNRAEHAEALNAQYRVTVQALKAEVNRLANQPPAPPEET